MDPLDQLLEPASDLLARVDEALVRVGAPQEHPVWPLLRRIRALPGTAVRAVSALRPGSLATAGRLLLPLAEAYGDAGAVAGTPPSWSGAAAGAYARHAAALAGHLSGGGSAGSLPAGGSAGSLSGGGSAGSLSGSGSAGYLSGTGLAGQVGATVEFAESLIDWMTRTRLDTARALAAALCSAQAVTVRTATGPSPEVGRAAADIAASVLRGIADAYEGLPARHHEWGGRLAERPFRASADDPRWGRGAGGGSEAAGWGGAASIAIEHSSG